MRLSKWVNTQIRKSLYQNKSHYANCVDDILVQICSYAKNNVDNSKCISRKWRLDDFEIKDDFTIIPSCKECICDNRFPSQLKEYGLYEIFLKLLMPEVNEPEELAKISVLDLPAALQEFDTVLRLLQSNEIYDFWDFPISVAQVNIIDVETNGIIKQDNVFIEAVDEVFVFPDRILINRTNYRIIESPQIHYSFLRKCYSVYVQMEIFSSEKIDEFDLGVVALDGKNRRIFVPLKKDGADTLVNTLQILPKTYLPYISVALVLRKKTAKSIIIEDDKNNFTILPEICLYLQNYNSINMRNVRIAVSRNYLYGGLIKAEIAITENTNVEVCKAVEIQL